jgi:hypothetical protein
MHPKPMTPTSGPLRPSVVVRTVVRFLLDNTTQLSERGRSFSVVERAAGVRTLPTMLAE